MPAEKRSFNDGLEQIPSISPTTRRATMSILSLPQVSRDLMRKGLKIERA